MKKINKNRFENIRKNLKKIEKEKIEKLLVK